VLGAMWLVTRRGYGPELAGSIYIQQRAACIVERGMLQRQIVDEFQLIPSESFVNIAFAIEEV
jgi:hypothetical protein